MKTVILFILVICFSNSVIAQLNPQPYEGNPVVPIGVSGTWDDSALWWSGVTVVKDTFYMVYNGTEDWPLHPASIGLATSHDGFIFTKSTLNPIFGGDGSGFDAHATTGGSLYFENGTWYLYYSGKSASPNQPGNVIGRAIANNPHGPWIRTNDTLLTAGNAGEWDDEFISPQTILSTDDGLVMYYWAGESWPFPKPQIGMATSIDQGITWQKYDDPVTTSAPYAESDPILKPGLVGSYDDGGIWGCSVLIVDGEWKVFYGGDSGSQLSLCYATSENGIIWEKDGDNPLLNPSQDPLATSTLNGPAAVFQDNKYFIYYSHGVNNIGISLATSSRYLNVPHNFPTIQGAINDALDGDIVLVDEGTYLENINFNGKKITVASHFYLDGDTSHISKTIIDGSQPSNLDSSSVVYFVSDEDTTSVICGFTITGGAGTYVNGVGRLGGGIFARFGAARICNNIIENNTLVTTSYQALGGGIFAAPNFTIIENNIIRENYAESNNWNVHGGGIYFEASGRITGNTIKNNEASYNGTTTDNNSFGGGVSCFSKSDGAYIFVEIKDNKIIENQVHSTSTANGGGVDLFHTNSEFTGNTISNNRLNGAFYNTGCGMRFVYSTSSSLIKNNVFSYNTALNSEYTYGGGMYMSKADGVIITENLFKNNESTFGGGLEGVNCTNLQINQNKFISNSGIDGGGLLSAGSNPVISNNVFKRNRALYGGGIASYVESPTIVKNIFAHNKADSIGGGVALWTEKEGGAIKKHLFFQVNSNTIGLVPSQRNKTGIQKSTSTGTALVINNTFTGNSADSAGGALMTENMDVEILNSILWDNSSENGAELWVDNADVSVNYTDIQGGWPGTNNGDFDPQFADTSYHLDVGSLCIDAGHPGSIYEDEDGSQNDMGAHGGVTDSLIVTDLKDISDKKGLPKDFVLAQNYPNPFNPITIIEYQLPKVSQVDLSIYNLLGQKVASLVSKRQSAGRYQVEWDASKFSSGMYFIHLKSRDFIKVRKSLLIK